MRVDRFGGVPVEGVALYLRVSTEEQDLEGQERELRDYVATKGWEVVATYREKASASGRVARDQFKRLMADALCSDRAWTRVVVWALDRWSRESFVQAIGDVERLERHGVRWHSLREPNLDSGDDGVPTLERDLLRGILPTLARFEARRRSERTLVAMKEIKEGRRRTKSGRPPGRQPRVTETQVRDVVLLRQRGLPYSDIAQRVRLPVGTCRRVNSLARRGLPAFVNPAVRKGMHA